MRRVKVITVTGNIGSGKSTVAPMIAKALDGRTVFADNLFQTTNPFRERYLKDIRRWALTNELWLTVERVKLLRLYRARARRRWIVVDSGLLMSWAYTRSHYLSGKMSSDEWGLYKRLYDRVSAGLFRGTAVVSLECRVGTLRKRVEERAKKEAIRRFELKYYTPAYLRHVNRGVEALKRRLIRQGVNVVTISEKEVKGLLKSKAVQKRVIDKIKLKLV